MENAHAIGDWRPLVTERSVTYKRSSTTGKFVQHSFKGEPAVVRGNGDKEFWKNGKRHNDNGPAVRKGDGTEEYYLDDEKLTKTKWNNRKNKPKEPKGNPPVVQSVQVAEYKTIKALREEHGNVARSHITGKPGKYVYSPLS